MGYSTGRQAPRRSPPAPRPGHARGGTLTWRSVRDAAMADAGRAIAMALGGALAFAPSEYVLGLAAYPGTSGLASKLRLVALTSVLALVLWLALAVALSTVLISVRLVGARIDPERARRGGWFIPGPLDAGIRRGVPRVWAATGTGLALGIGLQRAAVAALQRFKEPQLTAIVIAAAGLAAVALAPLLQRALVLAATTGSRALAPVLGVANPLGRWRAAGLALAGVLAGGLAACWIALPQSRSVLPVHGAASAVVIALGMGVGARVHAGHAPRWLGGGRAAAGVVVLLVLAALWLWLPATRGFVAARIAIAGVALVVGMELGAHVRVPAASRRRALAAATGTLGFTMTTLLWWGADLETKYVALTASPAMERLIGVIRIANDLDRDGFGTVLGEADCAPFDRAIHPGAIDVPDDGIDQNCDGHDFSLAAMAVPSGPVVEVPAQFRKPWNVLLLTIDTVRYDRTSFGGYATGPRRRDTTPRLAELVQRSTSFTFAQAPSAGTMASIPAILTSKFFHSGIALGDAPRGVPPKILPENTLLPEIMKRGGYRTGAIGSHEWWNDWGIEQGVDDYDNSIGKTPDPFRVAADKVTDRALAWISRHQGKKWFLWAHYIDPHGRYVAHPDVIDYGASESDLYDAELRWTDQQIGRLLDELRRLPSNDHTIVVITSDHGDSMAEHNVPLGTHGTALYREMLHVPLIFHIPGNPGRQLGGAVTPLDIVPTVAELCGIDVRDLAFEGRSLVPALFAGREDHDRVVFAETNAPHKQRAAISSAWKLIYYLHNNVYELYDLARDPWEKLNLAPKAPASLATMKQALQLWMDRVLYARDPVFNQAYRQMADVLSDEPAPVPTVDQRLADGAIEVAGIGPAAGTPLAPGAKVDLHVYFRVVRPTQTSFRFQLLAWPRTGSLTDPMPGNALRSPLRATADGAYPTERWRPGEPVRERFTLAIPAGWTAPELVVGMVAYATDKVRATGATPANDPTVAVLGVLPVATPAPPPAGPGSSAPGGP